MDVGGLGDPFELDAQHPVLEWDARHHPSGAPIENGGGDLGCSDGGVEFGLAGTIAAIDAAAESRCTDIAA